MSKQFPTCYYKLDETSQSSAFIRGKRYRYIGRMVNDEAEAIQAEKDGFLTSLDSCINKPAKKPAAKKATKKSKTKTKE